MIGARGRRYLTDAVRAFDRAPVEVAIAVVLAIGFSYAIDQGDFTFPRWLELAVAGALCFAAAWTGTLLHALGAISTRRRWMITSAGAAIAAAYALLVLDLDLAAEGWRAFMLVAGAVLWLLAVPVFSGTRERAVDRMRAVDGRILLRVSGALLYAAALFAGLALALGAVNSLFELNIRNEIYGHVAGWIFLVLAPWIVIGGLAEYARPLGDGSAVAGVVHRMTVFLVPPLLALYYVILYAYAVRIGITGEVPKNMLSPMVMAAGVLAAMALVLFEPDHDDAAALRWLRFAPPLFLPPAALGVWAIWLRVDQYGWTEFRLLRLIVLLVLAGLAVGATVQLVRRRPFSLHALPLALAAALVLAAIGPWSVLSASRRSQQTRLGNALVQASIDPRSAPPPRSSTSPRIVPTDSAARRIPFEQYERINDTARYLLTHHGSDALPPVLARDFTDDRDRYDLAASLGLAPQPGTDSPGARMFSGFLGDGPVPAIAGRAVYRINGAPMRGQDGGNRMMFRDSVLVLVTPDGGRYRIDLSGFMRESRPGPDRGNTLSGDRALLPVTDDAGAQAGEFLVLHIAMGTEDGVMQLHNIDGLLFRS
ncbi:MAG: DUF4153 domain-containing protein, partial [Gemmatimonadota bacterium]